MLHRKLPGSGEPKGGEGRLRPSRRAKRGALVMQWPAGVARGGIARREVEQLSPLCFRHRGSGRNRIAVDGTRERTTRGHAAVSASRSKSPPCPRKERRDKSLP